MQLKKNNDLSLYFKEINEVSLLTREQEDVIARAAASGNKDAQLKLIEANLRFVVSTAKKFQSQGLPLEDLISEGNIGLMNAISRYDPDKGYHFISYAVWWIRQAILKAIYEKSRMIRLPMNRANELVQINNTKKAYLSEYGNQPSDTFIADITGIKEEDVKVLQAISRDLVSLEAPVYDKEDTSNLGDFIEDVLSDAPEEQAIKKMLTKEIDDVLGTLSEKEAKVIRYRFGLGDTRALSLKEIGDILGLTKERIRQIEKKALNRLRHPSRSHSLRAYIAA